MCAAIGLSRPGPLRRAHAQAACSLTQGAPAGYAYAVPLVALALALFVVLAAIVLMPLSLVQRYRAGTARRLARGWIVTLNLFAIVLSTMIFLASSAVTNIWIPGAFGHSAAGLAAGCVLGALGLALTRWEATAGSVYYTPNRWLVLGITLVVTVRVGYGVWRTWQAWRLGLEDPTWVAATGAAGSLAAGAIVLGYYLVYWVGVRRRLRRAQVTGRTR